MDAMVPLEAEGKKREALLQQEHVEDANSTDKTRTPEPVESEQSRGKREGGREGRRRLRNELGANSLSPSVPHQVAHTVMVLQLVWICRTTLGGTYNAHWNVPHAGCNSTQLYCCSMYATASRPQP